MCISHSSQTTKITGPAMLPCTGAHSFDKIRNKIK
jgi:hypothetical protein